MAGEKTEEPTHQKLQKAREKGQVSKSQDFTAALGFAGSLGALILALGFILSSLSGLFVQAFQVIGQPNIKSALFPVLRECGQTWVLASIPVLLAAIVCGVFGNYFQVGALFTTHPLIPKLEKLNPVQGVKNLFSKKRILEVLKQLIKFAVVGYVVYSSLKKSLHQIILMPSTSLEVSLHLAGQIIFDVCIKVVIIFAIIGVIDFFLQKRIFRKSMMMTRDEVKREYKESEGDPETKGERKRLAHELVMQGDPKKVKTADAVITNPSHIAVAFRYDENNHDAPIVVAKGAGIYAEKIKEIAKSHHVPILRNIPLAHAMNKIDVDCEIPEELYQAVAEVLNFVYELKIQEKN